MSPSIPEPCAPVRVFAALGDRTRLGLVATLSDGQPRSISELTQGARVTRQALSKHLRVLEGAGVVDSARIGRETIFAFRPERLAEAATYLDEVAAHWDQALARLRSYVEE